MAGPENSPFGKFINSLDLSWMPDTEHPNPPDLSPGILELSAQVDTKPRHELSVGGARFRFLLDTSLHNPHAILSYPSRLHALESGEVLKSATQFFDSVLPRLDYVPVVKIENKDSAQVFNLRSYWDGKRFENAFNDRLTRVIFAIPSRNLNGDWSQPANSYEYGLSQPDENTIREYVSVARSPGADYNSNIAKAVLSRNSGCIGVDVGDDAKELHGLIDQLYKTHPVPKIIGW